MNLFRIHIRPTGGEADMDTTFDYCLKHGVLGVGWRTEMHTNTSDWETYCQEASKIHPDLSVPNYIKDKVAEGDLVWTRDAKSNYYLGRVRSGWEYWASEEGIAKDVDVANVFRCDIHRIPDRSEVPGKVIACFRPSRTIQKIADHTATEYSKYLWNRISGQSTYAIESMNAPDIYAMLDDEETEDLVFLYLQTRGWYVVPNSRKADTHRFEYLVVNPNSGEKGLTQVKTGNVQLNRDDYANETCTIFLFQSNENYTGAEYSHMKCISRKTLAEFLSSSHTWLPDVFSRKMEMIRLGAGHNVISY